MKGRSREIIEIMADVVEATSASCRIAVYDYKGNRKDTQCSPIHYVFGNAKYFKDNLDEMPEDLKFPCICLFGPFLEKRNSPDYHTQAKVRLLIATSSSKSWSNEERRVNSFENILRPVYRSLLEALEEDDRFDFGYDGHIPHDYSENYTYGKYGAFTETGEEVSEPIDAIILSNLELKVKLPNCRLQ